jgi:hypothetical protein
MRLTSSQPFATLGITAYLAVCAGDHRAEVAELADAHGSGPCTRKGVGVRVPSSAPVAFFSTIYRHGVHKTVVLVLILVSITRIFCANFVEDGQSRPCTNRMVCTSMYSRRSGRTESESSVLWCEANGRLRDKVRVNGHIETHDEGVYYIEWREDGQRRRKAIPNHAEVLYRARLKALELEARQVGTTPSMRIDSVSAICSPPENLRRYSSPPSRGPGMRFPRTPADLIHAYHDHEDDMLSFMLNAGWQVRRER